MTTESFRLKVELDPQPEDRLSLQKWPRTPLLPDLATVAAGWIALELGGRAIRYEKGRLVEPAAPTHGDPLHAREARIGDYVLIFLQRLLDAIPRLSDGQPHEVGFGDNPACLVLRKSDGDVHVSYRESRGGPDVAQGQQAETRFLTTVKAAASHYLEELHTVNAALRDHPDVAALVGALRKL